jgi:hypothetical protein
VHLTPVHSPCNVRRDLQTSKVQSLRIDDIDLIKGILTIRDSKLFATRLVPIGPKTGQLLSQYASRREALVHSTRTEPFFLDRNANPVPIFKLEEHSNKSTNKQVCIETLQYDLPDKRHMIIRPTQADQHWSVTWERY